MKKQQESFMMWPNEEATKPSISWSYPAVPGAFEHVSTRPQTSIDTLAANRSLGLRSIEQGIGGWMVGVNGGQRRSDNLFRQLAQHTTAALALLSTGFLALPHDSSGTEWLEFSGDRQVTQPIVHFDEVRDMNCIDSKVPIQDIKMDTFPDRVRVPMSAVRIVRSEAPEEPEWNPLDYQVQLALDKYFERDNANLRDS